MGKRQRRRDADVWRKEKRRRRAVLKVSSDEAAMLARTLRIDKRVLYGLVVVTCIGYVWAVWGALT